MTAAPAPFHADVTEAPEGGRVLWRRSFDGVRLRIGFWHGPEAAKGTVFLFTGRTEYIEKYGPAAGEFLRRGYAFITGDWRGQGLSDRPMTDPGVGHVAAFRDYQRDVLELVGAAREAGLPQPWYLLSHSMGGAIALRAVSEGMPVRALAFSAPMWGIHLGPFLAPVARFISTAARWGGQGHRYAPMTGPVTYVLEAEGESNLLTSDPQMWGWMQRQLSRHPDLALGGPSLHWLHEALAECRIIQSSKHLPALPCYVAMGSDEKIVDPPSVRALAGRWPGARLDIYRGARHEIMMEVPGMRRRFYDAVAAHFDAAG